MRLFNLNSDGKFELRKWSEHGLGHLQDPIDPDTETGDWIEEAWRYILSRALRVPVEEPAWIDRPALSRVTASFPDLLKRLEPGRKRKPYAEQIKPWNFLHAAHVTKGGLPRGANPEKFQLYGPYSTNPKRSVSRLWTERYRENDMPSLPCTSPAFAWSG